ncbi:GNAT family N-acetyltransferase [Planctobacterium marinum]|uniref:GNAT family N-acetyltransferase n=1 Tax=Planctobacterium marinum TaxID=1631968 RepID=UPI001E63C61A|nr:N-acetyltransferase [Planctobacterium marinum]MCC2604507.1 GNAT family N-acetyltransferase [Planctobacterium marinum]
MPLPEPHSLTFKAFSPEYCQQLRSWFTTPEQIIFWSGYKFGHPATLNEFANQLKLVSIPAYAMLSADGQLIGFGQMMFDNGRCHLVRVAVSPAFRGQGYGKMLLNCLYLQGQKLHQPRYFSLFVNKKNASAIKLYVKAGFQATRYHGVLPNDNSWYMEKPVLQK